MVQLIILGIVFLLTAVRHIGKFKLQIWQIMCGGAVLSLLTGGISLKNAVYSIDADVMIFLFCMFCAGQVLELSGWMARAQYKVFRRARTKETLLVSFVFFMGFASAVFMNDTIAVIGTPVALLMAKKYGIKAKELLLALAFSVTVGSVASPIGNPQNLLIAVKTQMSSPFLEFIRYLALPTIINLTFICVFIKLFYPGDFTRCPIRHCKERVKDEYMALLAKITVITVLCMILFKIVCVSFFSQIDFSITWIAAAAAAPGLLFSPRRMEIVKKIDWTTLVFFAGMFILMQSVWNTGYFQALLDKSGVDVASVNVVSGISLLMSQLISNVPLTALYLPILQSAGANTASYMALASSATIAGNLFVLGAASNVIIFQAAEKKGDDGISVLEFSKIGIPLTVVNMIAYLIFF